MVNLVSHTVMVIFLIGIGLLYKYDADVKHMDINQRRVKMMRSSHRLVNTTRPVLGQGNVLTDEPYWEIFVNFTEFGGNTTCNDIFVGTDETHDEALKYAFSFNRTSSMNIYNNKCRLWLSFAVDTENRDRGGKLVLLAMVLALLRSLIESIVDVVKWGCVAYAARFQSGSEHVD